MKEKHRNALRDCQHSLSLLCWELKTYGVLLSSVHHEESFTGSDLQGAGVSIKRYADELEIIRRKLEEILIRLA